MANRTPPTGRAALLAGAAASTAGHGAADPAADPAATTAAASGEGSTIFPLPDPVPSPLEQVGTTAPDAGRPSLVQADDAVTDAFTRRRSPPLVGDRAMPLSPIAPFGHSSTAGDPVKADPVFRRESTIDRLTRHPVAGVRQRALEAQAAIHHGAPDIGIKVRAALDTAREADRTR